MRTRLLAYDWRLIFLGVGLGLFFAFPRPSLASGLLAAAAPERPETEADSDRGEASARLAAGKKHEHREEFAEALRCYQRALRLEIPPPSTRDAVVSTIVRLAVRLQRYDEAARYALLAGKLQDVDPAEVRQIALYLTERGDYDRAAAMFELAVTAHSREKTSIADRISLQMEAGRLCQWTGRYKRAAECFARVLDAINDPAPTRDRPPTGV